LLPLAEPELLEASHDVGAFRCGVPALDHYLSQRALADQRAEKSRTYVAVRGRRVVAFFTLAAGAVEPGDATPRAAKGQGRQPIPVVLLARLAVDESESGGRLDEAMLVDALRRATTAADAIGARAVLVHAKNEDVQSFYLRYGFESSSTNPLHLMMLMKDVRASLVVS